MTALLVALGAAVGAPLRYLAGQFLDGRPHRGSHRISHRFSHRVNPGVDHRGTLLVNVLGSAGLGALVGAAVEGHALALLGTGFCGGLTTYSSFAVQAVEGGRRRGTAYAVITVAGCLAAATLGHLLAASLS